MFHQGVRYRSADANGGVVVTAIPAENRAPHERPRIGSVVAARDSPEARRPVAVAVSLDDLIVEELAEPRGLRAPSL